MDTNRTLRVALLGCCGALLIGLSGGTPVRVGETGHCRTISGHERKQTAAQTSWLNPVTAATPALFIDADDDDASSVAEFDQLDAGVADSLIDVGLENAGRLLPLAKKLTIESLHRTAVSLGMRGLDLSDAERRINSIDSVALDDNLYDWAEVDLNQPSVIRVGMVYAFYLTSNEEAVFLLGHELTHVAAWSGNMSGLIDSVSLWAGRTASVFPAADQKEDLACDFIGEQTLKLYVFRYPSPKPIEDRVARGLMYEGEPLSEDYADADEEHLSYGATMAAWIGLDPELRGLVTIKD